MFALDLYPNTNRVSILPDMLYKYTGPEYDYMTGATLPAPDKIHLYFTKDSVVDIDNKFTPTSHLITPKISLQVSVINGEFDDKFYINVIGKYMQYQSISLLNSHIISHKRP